MACYAPQKVYFSDKINPATGKRPLVFKKAGSHSGIPITIPCKKCVGCRYDRAQDWKVRLVHEAKMHPPARKWFLTLTYEDKNLPPGHSLVKRHLQLFLKRFRKKRHGNTKGTIRYFGCGEYGDRTNRPHYHMILYGADIPDRKIYNDRNKDNIIYSSKELDDVWGLGSVKIGSVTPASCAYTAEYSVKKQADKKHKQLESIDQYGEIHDREKPFSIYSKHPELGRAYFDKYSEEIWNNDCVIIDGRETRVPARYNQLMRHRDAARYEALTIRRLKKSKLQKWNKSPARLKVRETLAIIRDQKRKRTF